MRFTFLILSLLIFTACLDDDDRVGIEIQVENLTGETLEDFTLIPGVIEDELYGNIPPGTTTDFRFFENADYCDFDWSTFIAADTFFSADVTCFIPSPIPNGRYRIVFDSIGMYEGNPYLASRFIEVD